MKSRLCALGAAVLLPFLLGAAINLDSSTSFSRPVTDTPAAILAGGQWDVIQLDIPVPGKKCGTDGGGTNCECYAAELCSPTDCEGCPEGQTCGGVDCSNGLYGWCGGCPVNGYTDKRKCICDVWSAP